jgi:hypothetical protein
MPAYQKYVVLEEAELVCRMAEAFAQTVRPSGMTADEAVANMPPEMRADWLRVSRAVRAYWEECCDGAATIQ